MSDKKTEQEGKEHEESNGQQITSEQPADDSVHTEEQADKGEGKTHKDSSKHKKEKSSERIAELEATIAELKDRHLRLQAEFDNFRKRTLREKAELIKSGGETVLSNILPIVDDFDRALGTMKDTPDEDPAKIGFELIFSKFREFLKQNNVKEIEATGMAFDVDQHFALTKIPAPSEELKGKIVDVIQKGYMLNDKVIRFAKVVIGE